MTPLNLRIVINKRLQSRLRNDFHDQFPGDVGTVLTISMKMAVGTFPLMELHTKSRLQNEANWNASWEFL